MLFQIAYALVSMVRRGSMIVAAFGLLAAPAPATAQSYRDTLEKITKTGEFHIGFVVLPPSVFKDSKTNEPTGYYIDAAKYLADQMGVKPVFHEESWTTFISGLQTGRYDLSIASTVQTIPRALAVAFTDPLGYIGTCIIVGKNSAFQSVDDLMKPKTKIGVIQGAFMVPWTKKTFPQAEIIESSASAFVEPMSVVTGRTDASVTDAWVCRKFASEHEEVRTLYGDDPLNISPTGWMVRRDDIGFLNFINTSIRYMRSNGSLKQFVEKYDASQLQEKKSWELWGPK